MTALLTDEAIWSEAEEFTVNPISTDSFRQGFRLGAEFARSIYEARLAEDAKVRAGLVEALNDSNNTLGFLAWQVFGAPGFTDRHDDQGVCLRRMKTNDAALAAAKERG